MSKKKARFKVGMNKLFIWDYFVRCRNHGTVWATYTQVFFRREADRAGGNR